MFAYRDIPTAIELLKDNEHPVKVGLSDAYIIDRTIFCESLRTMICIEALKIILLLIDYNFLKITYYRLISVVRRKTIYEYHRINKMKDEIKSGIAIVFRAQKTCNIQKSCNECVKIPSHWEPQLAASFSCHKLPNAAKQCLNFRIFSTDQSKIRANFTTSV